MGLKIGGTLVNGPKQATLILPREPEDVVFRFIAVLDADEFDKIYPMPKPPVIMKTGIGRVEQWDDPKFKQQIDERNEARTDWFFLKSVAPSNIEWEKVKLNDPYTFKLWREEMRSAGFGIKEVELIYSKFLETNIITDVMLNEARERFLAKQQAPQSENP